MFTGLSANLATIFMIAGPVLILVAEGPAILRWLERRRLDPLRHPELQPAKPAPTREISTDGLLDKCPTEPLQLQLDSVRAALKAGKTPRSADPPMTETVLVGAGGMQVTRVRPSIRENRS